MKLVLKERVFTLKERFNVTDEQEQPLYSAIIPQKRPRRKESGAGVH